MTIVLADLADRPAAATLDLAKSWRAADVLRDAIWVDRAGWNFDNEAEGVLVDGQSNESVKVQSELARRDITALRIVSLHVLGGEASRAPVAGIDEWQHHRAIRDLTRGTPVRVACGVIVAAARGVVVPDHLFYPRWDFNHLVVPEDRISDEQIPEDVVRTEVLVGQALACLAVETGMLAWAGDAVADLNELPPRNEPPIQVVRSYIRLIDAGRLLDKIVDATLLLDSKARRWPVPSGLIDPQVVEDHAKEVGRVADEVAAARDLHFRPYRSPGPQSLERLSLWEGLKLFCNAVLEILRNAPQQFVQVISDRLEKGVLEYLQARTYGSESRIVLTLRGRDALSESAGSLASSRYQSVRDLGLPGTDAITAEPELWDDLRVIACGLTDGSPFPSGVEAPRVGASRAVVPEPDAVVPVAGERSAFAPRMLPAVRLRSCDPLGASELERYLDAVVAGRPLDEGGEATGAEAGLTPETAGHVLGDLRTWINERGRSRSFVWRVGAHIANAVGAASRELADSLVIIHGEEPELAESEAERKIRKRFRRYLFWMLLLLVIAVGGTGAGQVTGRLTTAVAAALAVTLFVVWLLLVVRRFIRYAVQMARLQFRRATAIHQYYEAFARAQTAALAVTRFSALYWQYLDWAAALGVVMHAPWGSAPETAGDASVPDLMRPLSFVVAGAEVSDNRFQRRVAAARAQVLGVGWLVSAFDEMVRRMVDRLKEITDSPE
ncbi:MAG TPA: hypothetical protein VHK88_12220, partial [Aquihabitans sp.]|nr:hypothetical protein [Aquihabitans sp.]